MTAFDRVLLIFGILLLLSFRADAHDPSMAHHEWFNAQEMNPAARQRLGVPWKSCCDNGDVFKTRFRQRSLCVVRATVIIERHYDTASS